MNFHAENPINTKNRTIFVLFNRKGYENCNIDRRGI